MATVCARLGQPEPTHQAHQALTNAGCWAYLSIPQLSQYQTYLSHNLVGTKPTYPTAQLVPNLPYYNGTYQPNVTKHCGGLETHSGCVFCLRLHQLTHYLLKCLEKEGCVRKQSLHCSPVDVLTVLSITCSPTELAAVLEPAYSSSSCCEQSPTGGGGWPSCVTSRRNRSFHPQVPLRLVNGPHWRGSLRLCKEDSENKGPVQHNLHKNNVSNKFSPRRTAFELQNLKENCFLLRAKTT